MEKSYAAIVDVETTGFDPEKDEITEFAALKFAYGGVDGYPITESYCGIQEVSTPISDEVEKLTGLNAAICKGESIDWPLVHTMLEDVDYIIAHNAKFDKSFLNKLLEPTNAKWACTMQHIEWDVHGYRAFGLNYLACDHGFLNPFPHRALFDCATTYKLAVPYMQELLLNCKEPTYTVYAWNSPFDLKDRLKEQKFYWDPAKKVWFRDALKHKALHLMAWLKEHVYMEGHCHAEMVEGEPL